VALGRKAWLFAGSDTGGQRAAATYTLIATAKLNDVDPQAWLADVLTRIADTPMSRLDELLPWNYAATRENAQAASPWLRPDSYLSASRMHASRGAGGGSFQGG
jgi:transposase